MTSADPRSSARDFDFLIGAWRVAHRRLRTRLAESADWERFAGTTIVRPALGGAGNTDDNHLELPGGHYHAVTLRAFDRTSGLWSIWWLDGRTPGRLDPPVVGRFVDGIGTFDGDDRLDGRAIKVRFVWTLPTPGAPRWEQSFSIDAGASWEPNWTMDFTRERG